MSHTVVSFSSWNDSSSLKVVDDDRIPSLICCQCLLNVLWITSCRRNNCRPNVVAQVSVGYSRTRNDVWDWKLTTTDIVGTAVRTAWLLMTVTNHWSEAATQKPCLYVADRRFALFDSDWNDSQALHSFHWCDMMRCMASRINIYS